MDFDPRVAAAFIGTGSRAFVAAGAFVISAQLTGTYGQYASALIAAVAGMFFLADAYRQARRQVRRASEVPSPLAVEKDRKIDRLEALVDTVAVALFVLEPDGRIAYGNRAARLMAGAQIAKLADLRGAGPEAIAKLSSLPIGGRQVVNFEDGRTMLVWAGSFITPGSSPQRLLSLQSITGELDAAQIGAWQAMTRVLAHEMMNSLTPIVSLAQNVGPLAKADGMRTDILAAIDTIARRSAHLMDFVERYREVADMPAAQPEQIDLAVMFDDISRLIRSQTKLKDVALSVERPESLRLYADPDLLERALLNLVRNAIEALDGTAGGAVSLRALRGEEGAIFLIEDNGPGIPDELMSEIFVPFFTTKTGGSGIGLSLAKQVAMAHRGTLTAKRAKSGGMVFQLTIPAGLRQSSSMAV